MALFNRGVSVPLLKGWNRVWRMRGRPDASRPPNTNATSQLPNWWQPLPVDLYGGGRPVARQLRVFSPVNNVVQAGPVVSVVGNATQLTGQLGSVPLFQLNNAAPGN